MSLLLSLLVLCLILLVVGALAFYIVSLSPLDAKAQNIAKMLLAAIGLVLLLSWLFGGLDLAPLGLRR